MRSWLAFCLCCLVLFGPSTAFALGKGEASLSGGLGFSLALDDNTRPGASAEARLLRGLDDAWAGRLAVQVAWIPASGATGATYVGVQDLGFTWAADIFNFVPFVDLGIVFADIRGGGAAVERLGARAGVGADYLLTRHLALSCIGHVDYLALRLAGGHGTAPTLVTFALHLTAFF
jgi:hypothetical protein